MPAKGKAVPHPLRPSQAGRSGRYQERFGRTALKDARIRDRTHSFLPGRSGRSGRYARSRQAPSGCRPLAASCAARHELDTDGRGDGDAAARADAEARGEAPWEEASEESRPNRLVASLLTAACHSGTTCVYDLRHAGRRPGSRSPAATVHPRASRGSGPLRSLLRACTLDGTMAADFGSRTLHRDRGGR